MQKKSIIIFMGIVTFLFVVGCSEQTPLAGRAIESGDDSSIIAVGELVSGLVTSDQQKAGITPGGVVFYYDRDQQQWQRVPVGILAAQLYFVDVMENGQAYAFTPTVKEKVISTADGGKTWKAELSVTPRTTGRIRKDTFCTEEVCIRVGKKVSQGKIARSEDGGKTWKQQAAPINTKLNAVYCSDSLTCWIVGDRLPGKRVGRRQLPSTGPGVILRTTDGGVTWESLADRSGNLISTKFSDVKDVVVVKFNDVFFVDEQIGWVVGDHGMVLKTVNGGQSWALQATDAYIDYQLQSVVFKDPLTGWLVGGNLRNKGIIAWTTNGGERWDNVEVDGSLNSISVS